MTDLRTDSHTGHPLTKAVLSFLLPVLATCTPVVVRRSLRAGRTAGRGSDFVDNSGNGAGLTVMASCQDGVSGLQAVFARYVEGKVDPASKYMGNWFGVQESGHLEKLGPGPMPVVGILGSVDRTLTSIGLLTSTRPLTGEPSVSGGPEPGAAPA
jgi:hypothetical protein